MAISETQFENEAELEAWALANLNLFLGECLLVGKTRIITQSGKAGIPDAFAFNFDTREWYVIECELLKHGVWPHIAEQVTRFVVALQNQDSLRRIRDAAFEAILDAGQEKQVANQLGVSVERLLQQLELLIEGAQPQLAIFIDDTNQDLTDFAHALDCSTSVFRVRKLAVNGTIDYYSPDHASPTISTTPELKSTAGTQSLDVVQQLGGGEVVDGRGKFKCFSLADGRVIHVKRSKFHEKNNYYWYGINPSSLEQARDLGVTHFVFVLGDWGFVVAPIDIVEQYCRETKTSRHPDGEVRHYHVLISPEPDPTMYWSNSTAQFDVSEHAQPFAS